MPRTLWLYFCLLILSGCARHTVYLHPGDEPTLAKQLQTRLQQAGYRVRAITNGLPQLNDGTQIIYHPLLSGSDYLATLTQIIKDMGLGGPELKDINQANQFFSEGNLGIFLPRHHTPLPPVMATRDCNKLRATLEPLPSGELRLEIVQPEQDLILKGTYRLDKTGSGSMKLNGQRFRASLSEIRVNTGFGIKDAALLELEQENKTQGPLPTHCSFLTIYGL